MNLLLTGERASRRPQRLLSSVCFFWGLGALLLTGCDEEKPQTSVTRDRNQAVLAKTSAEANSEPKQAPSSAKTENLTPKPHKALCGGKLSPGYALPDTKLDHVGKASGDLVPAGKWVWLNFWAAWCEPCKEEIPRLLGWQKTLTGEGKKFAVSFITLDDDQRQLDAFLKGQSSEGLQGSYWLKEGKPRESWLTAAKLDPDPNLPFHVLLDPKGEVRCVIQGAVEDRDLPDLRKLIE
ncbi:MAG: TlpA family protein disulfide reductase [Polyangiaceae bacterium]|nr:TlpA family protein disulfide reductase [Polyangiaceae bacterium]